MTINSIHRTKIVSFPRSGHHLLVRGLQAVFERELVYSEGYGVEHNFLSCPMVNVQKTHDFNLTEPAYPDHIHVVQYRGRIKALRSWYKLSVMYENETRSEGEFIRDKTPYYDGFIAKWVKGTVPGRITLDFDYLVHHKATTLLSVAKRIFTKPLSPYQIQAALAWEKREAAGY